MLTIVHSYTVHTFAGGSKQERRELNGSNSVMQACNIHLVLVTNKVLNFLATSYCTYSVHIDGSGWKSIVGIGHPTMHCGFF